MKLSLKEWESVQDFAQICCAELEFKYHLNVKPKIYRMFNDEMGISLQLFDKYDNFFKEYLSGIHWTVMEYKKAIEQNYFRIKKETTQNA